MADELPGSACPPSPDEIPVPPNFVTRAGCVRLQKASHPQLQAAGSDCEATGCEDPLHPPPRTQPASESRDQNAAQNSDWYPECETHTILLQGQYHEQLLPSKDDADVVIGDAAPIKKGTRPPKHVREESKRIAHETYHMLASRAPMEVVRDHLSRMMVPMYRDQKNLDYTRSVLRVVCNDYIDTLETVCYGNDLVQEASLGSREASSLPEIDATSFSAVAVEQERPWYGHLQLQ